MVGYNIDHVRADPDNSVRAKTISPMGLSDPYHMIGKHLSQCMQRSGAKVLRKIDMGVNSLHMANYQAEPRFDTFYLL